MNFTHVFTKMIEMFLIMIIGYAARKIAIIDQEGKKKLTSVVVNITLPATIFSSVMNQENIPSAATLINIIIFASLSYGIIIFVSVIASLLLRTPVKDRGIYQYIMMFGNIGFIGYPVTEAIFGKEAVLYTSIFGLPFNFIVYSLGIMLIKKSRDTDREKSSIQMKSFLKDLMTPCMAATVGSIIMAFANWRGPAILGDTVGILDGITTPASLMIIGASLAEMPIKSMFDNGKVYLAAAVKLVIIPLVVYGIFGMVVSDELLLQISVIVSAMPVAANGTILCFEYGGNEKLMAQGTFITTVLSIFTIPMLAAFIMH